MGYKSREAKNAYQLAYVQRNRQEYIDSQGGKCANCGGTEHLEVDHIDRSTKTVNPRDIWSRSKAFRAAELAKCQVLCWDCHVIKTQTERDW